MLRNLKPEVEKWLACYTHGVTTWFKVSWPTNKLRLRLCWAKSVAGYSTIIGG